jgi:hypothetical protein
MTHKEAKAHLEWQKTRVLKNSEISKAIDVAIQCLEDSIEGVKEVKDKGCACYGNNKIHPCFCNPYQQKSKTKNKEV